MYQRRDKVPEETPVKKPVDKKEEQPAEQPADKKQEPEQPTENKEAPEEPAVKIFNELTDCVNPKIIDDGECYKNTTGRWKINQIKTFTDERCKPIRIVDDCPENKISKLEYNCSADEKSFCSDAVGQLTNCKDKRTPVTTNEQDLDLVRNCGLKGLMSESEYKNAQTYFNSKGLTLPDLPNVNCTDFSQEAFCKNPVVRMQNCRSIQTTPNTDAQDLEIIRNCGANSDAISDAEYKQAQEYFSAKGLTLPNRPTTNCMDNSTQNFCNNPREQVEQCKFLRNTTDEEDFKRVQACYASKIKAELTPEELQKFELAKEYFKAKNMELLLPEVNCMDKTTENYCKNPVGHMSICQKLDGNNMTKEENLKLIQTCVRNNKITPEAYANTQAYLKTQGVDIPNMPDVNCSDLSLDAYCKKPVQRIQFCNDITPTEQELNTHLENIKNCKLKNKITADDYKQAQDFFSSKNMTLPNLPDINCLDESEATFCQNADKIIQNCGNIRSTDPEQYATLVRKCAYNGQINEQTYNEAKTFLKTKNIELPQFPNVICSTMNDDDFCKKPASYLQNCKDNSTLKQDLEITRFCGILGKTSQEEYKKAQEFFKSKNIDLIEMPDVDCKNTNETMFCANPTSQMKYCAPMRNKTIDQDYDAILECARSNKISREQYDKVKLMFDRLAEGGKVKTLPVYPDTTCGNSDSFCKDPVASIEFCKPQKDLKRLLTDVKVCKINGSISDEKYKSAQEYFKSKGLDLPSLPPGVNCKIQTTETFCKAPMDHITYCDETGIGDFTINQDFDRVKKNCVLEQNISPAEYERAKAYFKTQGVGLPNIPDVKCSDSTNNTKFCQKPLSYIKSCESVRDVPLATDYNNVIECMKSNLITESEYNLANEFFKMKNQKGLPAYVPLIDCSSIAPKELCKDPLSLFQKCRNIVSDENKQKTINTILQCSKQNLITKDKYNDAKTVLKDLPNYEPFDCLNASFCKDPAVFIQNCNSLSPKTVEEYKQDILNCVKNKKILDFNYNKAAEYLKNTSSVILPSFEELNADCVNICTNPLATLRWCKDRKFTLDQEVQQINDCILNGKFFDMKVYNQLKTYLDENKDKLKEYKLLDIKHYDCKNDCNRSFCTNLPRCLECSAAQNLNNPAIKKFEPSLADIEKGKLCKIEDVIQDLNNLNKKYPEHYKTTTITSTFPCTWKCESFHGVCKKVDLGKGMCNFTYVNKPAVNPCLPDNATIYVGCGFAYGSKTEASQQCGASRIKEYSLVTLGKNPCSIPRTAQTIFLTECKNSVTGLPNAYMHPDDVEKNTALPNFCGKSRMVVKWIDDGLSSN
jgi:hypothetical protein